jgi:peptidoglycan/xylan/chitin deacetylase (PgdA/CDA1 family)
MQKRSLAVDGGSKVPILMYHSISEVASKHFKSFVVSSSLFAEHMAYLRENNYVTMTVTQLVHNYIKGKLGLPKRVVVITFDDGFVDFLSNALPVLRQHGFTATMYIPTAFVNGTSKWLKHDAEDNRPILSWSQIRELHSAGIECGAHSHTHPQLDILPLARIESEILTSKKLLEDHLISEVNSFAYPFGYYNKAVKKAVQRAGYISACAVRFTLNSEINDVFALSRLKVGPNTSIEALERLLTGYVSVGGLVARCRTPVWQLARRSLNLISSYEK